jgi:hypothetical protein
MIEIKHNLKALTDTLKLYQEASGKKWPDVLANEAQWFANGLYAEFKKISPNPVDILAAARARGWRMGRKGNFIAPSVRGISEGAWEGADSLLEGRKSDYFKVSEANGMPALKRVRFSSRKGNKLLSGGRRGNKFAEGALRADQAPNALASILGERSDIKLLGRRAVAVAVEARLRAMAARGGTMALQWLYQVYRKRSSALVKGGGLVARTRTNVPIGKVDFKQGAGGKLEQITISGYVPGTAIVESRNRIVAKVEADRIKDRMAYITRKAAEAAKAAKLK